jgi:hypothetical protein
MYIYTILLRMADTMTSQNIDLCSWGTLYIASRGRYLSPAHWSSDNALDIYSGIVAEGLTTLAEVPVHFLSTSMEIQECYINEVTTLRSISVTIQYLYMNLLLELYIILY